MPELVYNNFSRGTNNRDANSVLRDEEFPDSQNIVLEQLGALMLRPGTTPYRSVPVYGEEPVTSLHEFIQRDGTGHTIAAAGPAICRLGSTAWNPLKEDFSSGRRFSFTNHSMNDICLMVNGEDGYFKFDGNSISEVDPYEPTQEEETEIGLNSIPGKAKIVVYHRYRIWLINVENYPDRAYFCGTDINGNIMYDYFPTTNWLRSSNTRGEAITAAVSFRGNLFLFTANTIRVVTGADPEEFAMQDVSNNVGCIGPRAIKEKDGLLFFVGIDGFYLFDGNGPPEKISNRIPETFKRIARLHRDNTVIANYQGKLLIALPESDINDLILEYNTDVIVIQHLGRSHSYSNSPWVHHRGIRVNDFLNTSDENLIFAGTDGLVYEYGVGAMDSGNPINAYMVFKTVNAKQIAVRKWFRRIQVVYEPQGEGFLELWYKTNATEDWVRLRDVDLSGEDGYAWRSVNTKAQELTIRFVYNYPGYRLKVNAIVVDFEYLPV